MPPFELLKPTPYCKVLLLPFPLKSFQAVPDPEYDAVLPASKLATILLVTVSEVDAELLLGLVALIVPVWLISRPATVLVALIVALIVLVVCRAASLMLSDWLLSTAIVLAVVELGVE